MTPEEKLREMLGNYARTDDAAAHEDHLRDEDLIRLIENSSILKNTVNENGNSALVSEMSPLREHLANCDSCLDRFEDFYAFFAPAGQGEAIAAKSEIDVAWQSFTQRLTQQKAEYQESQPGFWARFFSAERKTNYFAALGWGFAALLLLFSVISIFIAQRANNDKAQLSSEIEKQKQVYEERLKTLDQNSQNGNIAEQDKINLLKEKETLQQRIAELQTEVERAKQEKNARERITPPVANSARTDNSLVAVNTPIYDVFPADSAVRSADQSANNLIVPDTARSIVLILNATGRTDYPNYRAELVNSGGAVIWRGGGLKKDNLGNFTFTLSRTGLKNGNYRLLLFGKETSGWQSVADYRLTIVIK